MISFFKSIRSRILLHSRTKKLNHFYSLYKGGKVLDVGVSCTEDDPSVNLLLNIFRYPPQFYTGLAVQPLDKISALHPQKQFVEYSGGTFPFKNDVFDWVFSNAVIEHVGDKESQLYFINEMLRVGKNVFFTTPNKYFPVESHANLFFLHWFPGKIFYHWCERYRPDITRSTLNLISYRSLDTLMNRSTARDYQIIRNRFVFWTMTFTVLCTPSH